MTLNDHTARGRFSVEGVPKPQPRPRAFVRGKHASVYNPDSADAWKAAVRDMALRFAPSKPWTGPVAMNLSLWLPRPKRLQVAGASDYDPHDGREDIDNLAKAVMDAMADCGWWLDDRQVASVWAVKYWAMAPKGPSGTWWTGATVQVWGIPRRILDAASPGK